ncbi:MAG: hypothetical protein C6W55_15070 [Thermobacillus sp.]|uniref:hypothetical protein n=1 Tax=Thermobacillus sp. TaxID=2108467 RepID=UPI000E367AF9|nr:hypothetical protein [Thermobacillus sp.]REK52901.1 MAG: hypothetical protein C6W55_15070 [Thermobacillus sp.]
MPSVSSTKSTSTTAKTQAKSVNENKKGNVTYSQKSTSIATVTVNTGTGLGAKVSVAGVKAEISAKSYNSVSTSGKPTQNLYAGANVSVTNKLQIAVEAERTKEANGKTSSSGFAGVAAGDRTYGVGSTNNKGDIKIEFGVGAYLVAGGEVNVEVNLSEIGRRIDKNVVQPVKQTVANTLNKLQDPKTWFSVIY